MSAGHDAPGRRLPHQERLNSSFACVGRLHCTSLPVEDAALAWAPPDADGIKGRGTACCAKAARSSSILFLRAALCWLRDGQSAQAAARLS